MKLPKFLSLPTNSKWAGPVILGVGFLLGIMFVWVVLMSFEQLNQKPSAPVVTPPASEEPSIAEEPSVGPAKEEMGDQDIPEYRVQWSAPVKLSKSEFTNLLLASATDTSAVARILEDNDDQCTTMKSALHVGRLHGGDFDGKDVYLFEWADRCGMGVSTSYNFFVRDGNNKLNWIANWAPFDAWGSTDGKPNPLDAVFKYQSGKIEVPEMPERVLLKSGKILEKGESMFVSHQYGNYYLDPSSFEEVGTDADGRKFYSSSGGSCILLIDAVGLPHEYMSVIPTIREEGKESRLDATWLIPNKPGLTYLPYLTGGCGGHDCTDIVSEASVQNVIQAAETSDGDFIFIPERFKENAETEEMYDHWLTWNSPGEEKPSLDQMLGEHPIPFFFWKDALGRWVRYVESSMIPPVECGKPVIYLYPEKTTKVRVALPKFIKVTVSDPTYPKKGWDVTAAPDGTLTTKDGETYGSLYWEGTGVSYRVPKTGFVVKDGEVGPFLERTLMRYGLNAKESQEFRDFWVPKMTGVSPYYRISFLTSEWSKAAPLSVFPRPRTSIRLFMDWSPLSSPISIPEPVVATTTRAGFTLVEWGGVLYR